MGRSFRTDEDLDRDQEGVAADDGLMAIASGERSRPHPLSYNVREVLLTDTNYTGTRTHPYVHSHAPMHTVSVHP